MYIPPFAYWRSTAFIASGCMATQPAVLGLPLLVQCKKSAEPVPGWRLSLLKPVFSA